MISEPLPPSPPPYVIEQSVLGIQPASVPHNVHQIKQDNLNIWYRQPAEKWEEALPIGNGRIGGMVFGGVDKERIQFNEESLWSGSPQDADNPEALSALPTIRELLIQKQYQEAQNLIQEKFLCHGA